MLYQSTLAASTGACSVQDRRADIQGSPWHSTTVPRTTDRVADLPGRRSLRSASSSRLAVPTFRLSTVGSRSFNVSAPRIWNGLPEDVASALPLSTFRRRLKTYLFQQSYPDVVVYNNIRI